MITLRRLLPCSALALLYVPLMAQTAAPSSTGAAATHHLSCPVVTTAPSPGEAQLGKEEYAGAEATYRAELAKSPDSRDARLGLVRALVGQDKVADAQSEASAFLKSKPKDAVAEVAMVEASYRAGDIDAASLHAKAALEDDPCEGRADGAIASILELHGYYAKEALFLAQGHRLRPNDELLRRYWLSSLPRKQREAELGHYLESDPHLSERDSRGYNNELAALKAHKPGDCRITSKADSTKLQLQPIYGDRSHPVAFGLDVNFNNTRRRMQVDTGASGILLTPGAARALKLTPEYKIKTGGIGDEGEVDSYLAHVEKIRIGEIELSNCMVEVMQKSKLDVDGLIGMDVFSRWLVTLDYGNALAQLDPLPKRPGEGAKPATDDANSDEENGDDTAPKDRYIAPEMQSWSRVARIGHNILLPAELKPGAPSHYVVMDTGASETVLSATLGREIGKLHGSETQFYGVSGKVNKVYETDSTPLTIANLALAPSAYYAYDITSISHNLGLETSGFLGLPTLQRLTIRIDYRDNLIKLNYDPKHDVVRF